VNDEYGQDADDQVIKAVAKTLRTAIVPATLSGG
jgi:GGDEF domain-containing protein